MSDHIKRQALYNILLVIHPVSFVSLWFYLSPYTNTITTLKYNDFIFKLKLKNKIEFEKKKKKVGKTFSHLFSSVLLMQKRVSSYDAVRIQSRFSSAKPKRPSP